MSGTVTRARSARHRSYLSVSPTLPPAGCLSCPILWERIPPWRQSQTMSSTLPCLQANHGWVSAATLTAFLDQALPAWKT